MALLLIREGLKQYRLIHKYIKMPPPLTYMMLSESRTLWADDL